MSLDSGDEISHIEVFSNVHSEILARETKGSSGTDQKKNIQIELQSSLDVQNSLLEDKTYLIDCDKRAPIDKSMLRRRTAVQQNKIRRATFRLTKIN